MFQWIQNIGLTKITIKQKISTKNVKFLEINGKLLVKKNDITLSKDFVSEDSTFIISDLLVAARSAYNIHKY